MSLKRDRCRDWWCSLDHRATGRYRTVVGIGIVARRETGRHAQVVERRDERTGIAWSHRIVSSNTSVGVCVYRHSKLESRVNFPRERRRWDKMGPQISCLEFNLEIRHSWLSRPGSRRVAVGWSLTSHDGLVDGSAISIGDVGQGSNLERGIRTQLICSYSDGLKEGAFRAGSIRYWSCSQQRGTCQQSVKVMVMLCTWTN